MFSSTKDRKIFRKIGRSDVRDVQSKNTIKKTLFWLRGVDGTTKSLEFTVQFTDMDKATMAEVLCSHIMDMRRQDGNNYEISSVVNFFSLVGKYIRENNLGTIDEDVEFKILREVRNAKLKKS